MTAEQCSAARKLLGWNPQRLALRANTSRETVVGFESRSRQTRTMITHALRLTLEDAGVEFVVEDGKQVGVRLRREESSKAEMAND